MKTGPAAMLIFIAAFAGVSAEAVQYEGAGYRDPFVRVKKETAEEANARKLLEGISTLTLDGIAYSPRGSQAILSGQMVEVGQTVSGAEVVAISKDSVTIKYQGKEIVLKDKGNRS